jgi:membrane protease YdiL (CAAX protease family)
MRHEQPEGFPDLVQSLWLALAVFMTELICFALLEASGEFSRDQRMQISVLATVLGNGFVAASFLASRGLTYRAVLHPARGSPVALTGLVWLPLLMVLPAVYLVAGILQQLTEHLFPLSDYHRRLFADMTGSGLASLIGVVLVAPVVEELLFRGVILRGLLQRYQPRRAIIISAVIFGAAHLNLYQFIGASMMGLLLGWLYLRFDSTLPCILLHGFFNAAAMATADMAGGPDASFLDEVSPLAWVAALPAALAGAIALGYLARRASPAWQKTR